MSEVREKSLDRVFGYPRRDAGSAISFVTASGQCFYLAETSTYSFYTDQDVYIGIDTTASGTLSEYGLARPVTTPITANQNAVIPAGVCMEFTTPRVEDGNKVYVAVRGVSAAGTLRIGKKRSGHPHTDDIKR